MIKMTIRRPSALLFDLDHTLAPELSNYTTAFETACTAASERRGFDPVRLRECVWQASFDLIRESRHWPYCLALGVDSPSSLLTEFAGEAPELAGPRSWVRGYQMASYTRGIAALNVTPSDGLAEELMAAFKIEIGRRFPPYDDVIPALEILSTHYELGVITNGAADVQVAKLRSAGIVQFFKVVVASTHAGIGKPDPRIFSMALDALGIRAEEAVMIGDSVIRDIAGARAAGIPCVLLKRDDGWPLMRAENAAARGIEGVPTIATLAELPGVLQDEAFAGTAPDAER